MELFITQLQKAITKEDICETCTYAEFDTTDSDYSCTEYVADCMYESHGSDFVENIIEQMIDYKTQRQRGYCPFWLPKFPREFEVLRCHSCNSPNWECVPGSVDCEAITEKLKCMHCGEVRIENVHRVAYSYCPHNDCDSLYRGVLNE